MAFLEPSRPLACLLILVVLVSGPKNALAQCQRERDQAEILNCVKMVLSDVLLGFIDITGDCGFQLLTGYDAIVAGGRIGQGRVIGAGHVDFMRPESNSEKNSQRNLFFDNLFEWVSGGHAGTVAVIPNLHQNWYSPVWKNAFENYIEMQDQSEVETVKADVIIMDSTLRVDYAYKLIERIRDGMGVIILSTNPEYVRGAGYNSASDFNARYSPNVVGRAAGITFRYDTLRAGDGGPKNKLWSAISYRCVPQGLGRNGR